MVLYSNQSQAATWFCSVNVQYYDGGSKTELFELTEKGNDLVSDTFGATQKNVQKRAWGFSSLKTIPYATRSGEFVEKLTFEAYSGGFFLLESYDWVNHQRENLITRSGRCMIK